MLTDRQQMILAAIIYQYTQTARAVGSKTLHDQLDLEFSPATIRNEMMFLEEADLIKKLHTSAGRIPSKAGYRYYLDHLMVADQVSEVDIARIANQIRGNFHELDDLLEQTAKQLADLTGLTALVLKPKVVNLKISSFQLIQLERQQVLAVLATSDGKVTSQTFRLPKDMAVSSLSDMVAYINAQMVGRPVQDVLSMMNSEELPVMLTRNIESPAAFLQLFGEVLARSVEEQVHIGGRLNLLEVADDAYLNLKEARSVLELFDTPDSVRQLAVPQTNGVTIRLGQELATPLLQDYAILSAPFRLGDSQGGIIALVGPIRLPYSKVARLLSAFAKALDNKLIEYV
ncbi:heat-inducible transcription repressor hrcA [Fructobacillus pseudoficulneus]|uniref:Heat-inducible transcription repressor HrcA n=1 Tax=Fructobacillus pseudoficulneus TaxID=220714 RepID=A0A3F3GST9_9LACO|nr:heat-inducible transcriptional repressor HrcA [Fructobacillus pseudoficulneus]GAP02616.1 heat-inducible transcription repressor hrcA [Fructobacillus pseudoficulneus]SEH38586.1 heat-inducible transcription repressor HrcA [Fructobacillus pseudoficulneus]